MSVVIRKGNVTIKKLKDNKYKLDYEEGNYKHFWKFVKELIGEKNNNFEAHSVVSLKELLKEKKNMLSYHHLTLFFKQVGNQYVNLEKNGYGKVFIDLDDIVVIHKNEEKRDSIFLCLGLEDVYEIEKNEIKINFPYKKSRNSTFFSPELKKGKKFPIKIKKQSCIFSLCALIVSCIKLNFNLENIKEELSSLDQTKLYYALLRCLEDDAYNRYYLWI
tara:strand:- start:453 stop:1106 length:654 start_codon:yes stop_codon:yes gene_type:complete